VERNKRVLGSGLRSLFLSKSQDDWDVVLLKIMQVYRSSLQSSTLATPDFLMLGWETRIFNPLIYCTIFQHWRPQYMGTGELIDRMQKVHDIM